MRKHYNIIVSGYVQGVSFRAAAKSSARYSGVKGFVRNLSDGRVYIEAEGAEEQLKHFISWCKTGPPHALVENVAIEEAPLLHYKYFEVRF